MPSRVIRALAVVVAAVVASSAAIMGQTSSTRSEVRSLTGTDDVKAFIASRVQKNWTPPKKPWGDPDIEGVFTTKDEANTPFERPNEWAGRPMDDITPAELEAAMVKRREAGAGSIGRTRPLAWVLPGQSKPISPFDIVTAVNSRPWFVIDPPDGSVPALTAEGKRRLIPSGPGSNEGKADYTDRSLSERCLLGAILGTPGPYSNSHEILQTPDHVVIRTERNHEARIVPLDGRPHPGSSIRNAFGVSRGYWDGNTLVVVTTNFDERMSFRGSPIGNARVIERFTRIAPNKVEWTTTYEDPTTWTRPWSWSLPMTQNDAWMILEFACHEGNYGIPNILSAGRAAEKGGR